MGEGAEGFQVRALLGRLFPALFDDCIASGVIGVKGKRRALTARRATYPVTIGGYISAWEVGDGGY